MLHTVINSSLSLFMTVFTSVFYEVCLVIGTSLEDVGTYDVVL